MLNTGLVTLGINIHNHRVCAGGRYGDGGDTGSVIKQHLEDVEEAWDDDGKGEAINYAHDAFLSLCSRYFQ